LEEEGVEALRAILEVARLGRRVGDVLSEIEESFYESLIGPVRDRLARLLLEQLYSFAPASSMDAEEFKEEISKLMRVGDFEEYVRGLFKDSGGSYREFGESRGENAH